MTEPDTSTARAQAWDPSVYRERASFVHRLAHDLIDLLAPQASERVLDVGCGTGELTCAIAGVGASVLGVDASRAMIEAARQCAPAGLGVQFDVADGQELRYAGDFDAVFSNAALHWMPRAEDVAAGVARALRSGGRFVAEFGGHRCIAAFVSAAAAALERAGEDPRRWLAWYFPDVRTYVNVLSQAGLEVRYVHLFDRPTHLPGDDALAGWMRTFLAPLERHLGARWESFVRDVEASSARTLRRPDGWVLDYVRLRVAARKP
jgi:trans-aconitate methyltransferase